MIIYLENNPYHYGKCLKTSKKTLLEWLMSRINPFFLLCLNTTIHDIYANQDITELKKQLWGKTHETQFA